MSLNTCYKLGKYSVRSLARDRVGLFILVGGSERIRICLLTTVAGSGDIVFYITCSLAVLRGNNDVISFVLWLMYRDIIN